MLPKALIANALLTILALGSSDVSAAPMTVVFAVDIQSGPNAGQSARATAVLDTQTPDRNPWDSNQANFAIDELTLEFEYEAPIVLSGARETNVITMSQLSGDGFGLYTPSRSGYIFNISLTSSDSSALIDLTLASLLANGLPTDISIWDSGNSAQVWKPGETVTGVNAVVTSVRVIPEPSTALLVGLGLTVLGLRQGMRGDARLACSSGT